MTLVSNDREHLVDRKIDIDCTGNNFVNKYFLRLVSKGKKFENVNFMYTIFEDCYLRNCVFDSCNFTGCKFKDVNFYGAKFEGCKFDYATFERTVVTDEILDECCPGWDNLKLKFARNLRTNFQELGDSKSANKAIKVELEAAEIHLKKSWKSNESYYRRKYQGINRVKKFLEWLNFKILDLIWGNGENTLKLTRNLLFILIAMAWVDVFAFGDSSKIINYTKALFKMPEIFLGVTSLKHYPSWYLTIISFTKLMTMGFFMSIILKRFNRR
jgi:pentapeptide repeat protein